MLGGIAQAEVNDQLKDLNEQPNNKKYPPSSWKSFTAHSNPLLGSYTANAPVYKVYGNQESSGNENVRENSPKPKKNSGNNGSKSPQNKFPLVGTLMNYNKNKANSKNNNNNNNKHRNSNGNNNGHKSNKNLRLNDMNINGWNQLNKKQRSGQQAASSNQQSKIHPSGVNYMVLKPVKKNNKQVRDEKINNKVQSSNSRVQQSLTELRPPPHKKNHLRVTKVI